MNGAMPAAIDPIALYGLSKTTHAAIKAQMAIASTTILATLRIVVKVTLPPVRARRPAVPWEKN